MIPNPHHLAIDGELYPHEESEVGQQPSIGGMQNVQVREIFLTHLKVMKKLQEVQHGRVFPSVHVSCNVVSSREDHQVAPHAIIMSPFRNICNILVFPWLT